MRNLSVLCLFLFTLVALSACEIKAADPKKGDCSNSHPARKAICEKEKDQPDNEKAKPDKEDRWNEIVWGDHAWG